MITENDKFTKKKFLYNTVCNSSIQNGLFLVPIEVMNSGNTS